MKKLFLALFVLVLAVGFMGCMAAQTPQERHTKFVESEYTPYENPGTSTITGQAFMKTVGGDVKYGAACTVFLNPVTSYSTEWFERTVLNGERLFDPDPRAKKYHWETVADGNGNFEFKNLPAGDYYLACQITWQYATQYGLMPTGGTAYAKATVKEGETIKIVVTR